MIKGFSESQTRQERNGYENYNQLLSTYATFSRRRKSLNIWTMTLFIGLTHVTTVVKADFSGNQCFCVDEGL